MRYQNVTDIALFCHLSEVQNTKWRENIAESFNPWVGHTNVTDDRRIYDSKDPDLKYTRSVSDSLVDYLQTYSPNGIG